MGTEAAREELQAQPNLNHQRRGPAILVGGLIGLAALLEVIRFLTTPLIQNDPGGLLIAGGLQVLILAAMVWVGTRWLLGAARKEQESRVAASQLAADSLAQRLATVEEQLQRSTAAAEESIAELHNQLAARQAEGDGWRKLGAIVAGGGSPPDPDALLAALCSATAAEGGALALCNDQDNRLVSQHLSDDSANVLLPAVEEAITTERLSWIPADASGIQSIATIPLITRNQVHGAVALIFASATAPERDRGITVAADLAALALLSATTASATVEFAPTLDAATTPAEAIIARDAERPVFVAAANGDSLDDLLVQGRLTEAEGLRIIRAIAEILAPFHARGQAFLLRPHSVQVNPVTGEVYLRQNIITRQMAAHGAEYFEGFSAPELLDQEPSPAADVFALGFYLFLLYIGRRPPTGRQLDIVLDHLRTTSTLPGTKYLLRKALWPNPAHRLQDARGFLGLLDAIETRAQRMVSATPMPPINVDIGAELHVGLRKGRYRGANVRDLEDRLFWDYDPQRQLFLFAIADGVSRATIGSGSDAAVIVADEAAQAWKRILNSDAQGLNYEAELQRILKRSNQAVVNRFAPEIGKWRGQHPPEPMAAAVCLAIGHPQDIALANVGDVHAFLVAPPFVAQMTQPHTSVADALANPSTPDQALGNLSGSALSQTIGAWRHEKGSVVAVELKPATTRLALRPGESLVLASDGLYGYAHDSGAPFEDALLTVLESTFEAQSAAFRLMTLANHRGGGDNISCIVCRAVAEGGL